MGDYVKNANFDPNVPINVSQQRAVESLKFSLEKIQGPPGAVLDSTCHSQFSNCCLCLLNLLVDTSLCVHFDSG